MKKKICALFAAMFALMIVPMPHVWAEQALPQPPCAAYIVMDADSGQVLMEYNADEKRYPASITKIMTMGLALEKAAGNLDTSLIVSHDAVQQVGERPTHIALIEGEEVRLEDVLYGTEMESANDGANVLAEYVGGDSGLQGGVEAMNRKAAELGLANTHYVNAHGNHQDGHYTTARDMANITRWALTVPGFEDVFCRTEPWTMAPTNKQPQQRVFHNGDWMRIGGDYRRSYAKGSKSGFHDEAQRTFVTYAAQGDLRLISVVLGCPHKEDDLKAACILLDYAFEHYHKVIIPSPQESFPVDLVGGGESLGSVMVKAGDLPVILHDAFTAADVSAEYSVPEQYVLGRPFTATVRYKLRENNLQPVELGSGSMVVEGLPRLLSANTYIPQSNLKPGQNRAAIGVGVAAALMALLLMVRLLRRGKKMKQTSRQRMGQAEIDFISRQPRPNVQRDQIRVDVRRKPHTKSRR